MTVTVHTPDLSAYRRPHGAARPDAPALSVRDLVLEYPDGEGRTLRALDEVSLDLAAGTFTALIGPSGSGKSSLLAVAAGLVSPTSGTVHVAGTELTALSRAARTRLRGERIGVVFQQPNLLPSLTAREQLELTVRLDPRATRADRRAARDRAQEMLERVDLGRQADQRPHQLSGGQRQRVNIVRALMGSPALLLVDEPTSALDRERSAAVVHLLGRLTREEGAATLMVTHDVEFLDAVDRTLTMVDGRLS
ncbi:ABC transporter ATP-binding protein [Micrococcus flavus]|uniref:Putative ABC transport system ATP-binding protein n=1 Tax=Micrococcus flavus TaxID=384602 RepID=A0A4Y8X264_9MICC|nr:ABC transporter ATP-binding protein [Micrococcus flavus]MBB4882015.1 putative ABC transport system ATP-binding protein [Micrococcus flavus]TFI02874.1 ABC transporter ATP-binding protein [Micrococcus flavus]GGK46758.1 ABC transporter ATP-binding protein [Micrococcus flavus]